MCASSQCVPVCVLSCFSHVQLCAILWTVGCQSSPSGGFSWQEYRSVLPCPPPEDLSNQEKRSASLLSPTLTGSFFTISAIWEALPAHQFSRSVMSDSLWPHGLQHPRLLSPSPTPKACSNLCPLSQWCHLISSSSAIPFSSCLQSFPASGSFPMSQFFTSSGQSIGASALASVLPVNIQDWFPLGWTGLILQFKGLSRFFSNTKVQKHQFLEVFIQILCSFYIGSCFFLIFYILWIKVYV